MYNVNGKNYYVGDITLRQNKAFMKYLAANADVVKMENIDNKTKLLDITALFTKAADSRLIEEFLAIALTPEDGKWRELQLDDKKFKEGLQDLSEADIEDIWQAFFVQKKKWINSAVNYIRLLLKNEIGDILSNLSQK